MADFQVPDFIEEADADALQEDMMDNLPDDIDDMPGGFPYDFTMPTAILVSEMVQESLLRVLQQMFPQTAEGEFLGYHAAEARLARKEATYSTGTITITGTAGTVVPAGSTVSTATSDDAEAIEFTTDEDVTIGDSGTVDAKITAVEPGKGSNVNKETVTFLIDTVKGVDNVLNAEATTGGTDEEDDETLRARIEAANATSGKSWVGNDSDFVRWATEVSGVGDCIVVPADTAGSSTVKLVLIDSNGVPASDAICQAVYNHIVSPNDRSKRILATGNCKLIVGPAVTVTINYSCTGIKYDKTLTSIDQIVEDYKALVTAEYTEAKATGILYYNQLRGHITEISGVIDFDTFTVNGKTENVNLTQEQYGTTGTVTFTAEE